MDQYGPYAHFGYWTLISGTVEHSMANGWTVNSDSKPRTKMSENKVYISIYFRKNKSIIIAIANLYNFMQTHFTIEKQNKKIKW